MSATKIQSFNHASVEPLLAASLSKFNFEYVDLLLIHDPKCGPKGRLKMWRDVLKARDDGKAKTAGVSNL
jgi:diketogulonate reductase-like aldo/keto reductase